MINWKKNIHTRQDALEAIASLEEYLDVADDPDNIFDYQVIATAAIKIAKYAETLTE